MLGYHGNGKKKLVRWHMVIKRNLIFMKKTHGDKKKLDAMAHGDKKKLAAQGAR